MTEQQYNDIRKEMADLLKKHGFDQFVVMAHNCPKNLVFLTRSDEACSMTKDAMRMIDMITIQGGGVTLLNNKSSN